MNSCNLEDFSEGLIGKLIVRKSGKVQMMLGQTLLDVEMGTPCGFLQVNFSGPDKCGMEIGMLLLHEYLKIASLLNFIATENTMIILTIRTESNTFLM